MLDYRDAVNTMVSNDLVLGYSTMYTMYTDCVQNVHSCCGVTCELD